MDNKLISLLIKAGMGLLFLVGLVLIWINLSFDTSGNEPLLSQEFFRETYVLPAEDGTKPVEESITHYDYVLDNDTNVVYDLSNYTIYDMDAFVASNGGTKTKIGTFKEGDIDVVLMNEYGLQNATGNSITYMQWLFYGGIVLILLFTVINIVKEPKRFIRLAIGLVLLTVISLICYYSVEASTTGKITQLDTYSDTSYHISATGIAIFVVLTFTAGAMIVVGWVTGVLRYFSK
jgi:hypothetical protein